MEDSIGPTAPPSAVWALDRNGQLMDAAPASLRPDHLHKARLLPSGAEIWQTDGDTYITGSAPFDGGRLYVGRKLRPDFLAGFNTIESETDNYQQQRTHIRPVSYTHLDVYKRQAQFRAALHPSSSVPAPS